MNLEKCLIGPLERDAIDLCLQKELKGHIFFDVHNFDTLYALHQPESILLIEPLQRLLPPQVWDTRIPKIGMGSLPRWFHEGLKPHFDEILAALDAFIPLEDQVRMMLPESLAVSSTTAWVLGQQHELRNEAIVYPALLCASHSWSARFSGYFKLKSELHYFLNVNPVRLNFFLHRAGVVIVDEPVCSSTHFQVLASGARLLVPEDCQGLEAYFEPGLDYQIFNSETLADEFETAMGSGKSKPATSLASFYLAERLKQAFYELSEVLVDREAAPGLDVIEQAWLSSRVPSAFAVSLLQAYLPQIPPAQRTGYDVYFYLIMLKNHYFEGDSAPVYQRFITRLNQLPEGLLNDLYRFYWAYLCGDFAVAVESLKLALGRLFSGESWQGPEPWIDEPVLYELYALGYTSDALRIWLQFCLCRCLAQINQAEARDLLHELLEEVYFPSAVDLCLQFSQDQWPVMIGGSLLSKHPQKLSLAFAWIRELISSQPEQALLEIQRYQKLCQCLATELNALEVLIQLNHELCSDSQQFETPYILWEGPLYAHSSLATINRRWIESLSRSEDYHLTHISFEPAELLKTALAPEWDHLYAQEPDLYVSHRWPPRQSPPLKGKWVSIIPWEFGVIPESWVRYLNDLHDEVWMPSTFVAQSFAISGVDPARLRVIPNGIDPVLYCPEGQVYPLPTQKSFTFLFVGGTIYRKGFDLLLKAYQEAFSAQDDVALVIKSFGTDSHYALMSMQDERRQLNSPEIVLIEEDLSAEEMASLYRSCDVYVHPYRGEGFGMPILEAMASGLPVIVPNAGPAPEFCSQASGWYLPTRIQFENSRDVQGLGLAVGHPYFTEVDLTILAQVMKEAASDPDLCHKKGQKAVQEAQNYAWEVIFTELKMAVDDLAKLPFAHREKDNWVQKQLQKAPDVSGLQQVLALAPDSADLLSSILKQAEPKIARSFWIQSLSAGLPIDQALEMTQTHQDLALDALPLKAEVLAHTFVLPEWPKSDRLLWSQTGPGDLQIGFRVSLSDPGEQASEENRVIHYLGASNLPEVLPSGALWLAHPDLIPLAQEAGKQPDSLFYLPLAVDFERFKPEQPKMILPESEGRFVFLSIFDWFNDGAWKELLLAYFQAFQAHEPVNLLLKPYGADFDEMVETLMSWLDEVGIDAEAIPELTFVQEDLSMERLTGLYTGANCFVTAHGEGNGIWHLAAQASGVPVISCGHFPFLQRPFSEVFQAGDLEHLSWLLRSHYAEATSSKGLIVRDYLLRDHHAPLWQKRVEEQIIRSQLLQRARSIL